MIVSLQSNSTISTQTTTFENNNKLYVKAFLLDSSANLNDWGVTSDSLKKYIGSFVGRPLVLTDDFSHPVPQKEGTLNAWLAMQEAFRIGEIREITEKDGTYYAIIEITNDDAKDAISKNKVPLYVSPAIAQAPDNNDPDSQLTQWTGVHLAIVDKPAYTVKKAQITAQCGGDEDQCFTQLRTASIAKRTKCVKMLIASLSSDFSSLGFLNSKNDITLVEQSTTQQSTNSATTANDLVPKQKYDELLAKIAALEATNKTLSSENSELKEIHTNISERIAKMETERRTEKIANIVTKDIIADETKRSEKIQTLVASQMSIEQITDLFSVFTPVVKKTASVAVEGKVPYSSGAIERKISDAEIALTISGLLPLRSSITGGSV